MQALQKVLAVLAVAGLGTGVVAMLLPYGTAAVTCFGVALLTIPVSCMVGWMALR